MLEHQMTVDLGRHRYRIRRWRGEKLLPPGGYLAVDTETEVVDLQCRIPRLSLLSAVVADEGEVYLVHPDEVAAFLRLHARLRFVAHNSAFDFWVLVQHLRDQGDDETLTVWWQVACENRLHDSMLLDVLVRLAESDAEPVRRDLAVVAREYAGIEVDKADPYRLRYGELIGRDWTDIEDGFFTYAARDAAAVALAYPEVRRRAQQVLEQASYGVDIRSGARSDFGILTESIQVKKAIALAQVNRNGIAVDVASARKSEARLREELMVAVTEVEKHAPIYKREVDGCHVLSGKNQLPGVNQAAERDALQQALTRIQAQTKIDINPPRTTRGVSTSRKFWKDYAHLDPFLDAWCRADQLVWISHRV